MTLSSSVEEDFKRDSATILYNKWYNEQKGRAFDATDSNISLDSGFQRIHKHITGLDSFVKWCKKYQKGVVNYVVGSQGATSLPITSILNNYIKSFLGLPFYKLGPMKNWIESESDVVKEIGAFSVLPKFERYYLVRDMMVSSLLPIFNGVPFRDSIINAFVTVYHSETNMQVFVHNGYPNFGESFYSDAKFKSIGQPNSTAFGLGQWLGNRLLDYFYFTIYNISKLADPRKIGPEVLYHPSFQVAFMAYELRKDGYYYNVIVKTLKRWKNSGITPTYQDFCSLVLSKMQGIEPSDSQFAVASKIKDEKRTVDTLPAEFSSTHRLTKLTK